MSELKRVSFTTLSGCGGPLDGIGSNSSKKFNFGATAAALLQGHEPFSSSPGGGGAPVVAAAAAAAASSDAAVTSQQRTSKTFRLELGLFEPNSDSFPEFNYSKLVHFEKKKFKRLSKLNGVSDPFEENDDEVARIAKELEKKYGSSCATGTSRRKSKKDDYYDKGAGYDESDSFIDNTEAYDEIIPEEIETVEGGFYINSGALEFKHLSNYERPDDQIKMQKTKKRTLSPSSSSGDESERAADEAEVETEGYSSPKDANAISTANKIKNGHMDKKLKTSDNEKDSGKMKNKDRKGEKPKTKEDLREEEICSDSGKEKEKEKTVKTTTVKDMLKAKRDSFRKMQEGEGKNKLTNGEVASSLQSNEVSSDSSGEDSDSEEEQGEKRFKRAEEDPDKMRTVDVKLSEDISEDLLTDIQEMKNTAKSMIHSGKSFQFDDNVTEVFLRIDDACSCLDKSTRNQVFAHLEYQICLPKYFLLRKAKQLRIKQERTKTKKAYMKLKKAVAEVMPSVLLNYESNCRKVEEIRSTIPQEELEKMDHPPKYPKKKFPWTETLRNLLYELFQVRWTSFTVLRTRKETFEDFVNNYLRDKVVSIWPTGWMKFDDLRKELEKRKMSAKKPKENKKPEEPAIINKNKLNDETSITVVEKSTDGSGKSVLSSSNSMSVVSTKDLVVTITTKSSEKYSSEVPSVNTQQNSVSITQIPADMSSNKERNSPLAKCDLKSHKSSTGSNLSSRPSPQVGAGEDSFTFSKGLPQSSTSSSGNYGKSSSKANIEKTNISNSNSNSNVNNHKALSSSSSSISSKGPVDLVSPTKRATDHSINSIMSSPAPVQHSNSGALGLAPAAIQSVAQNKNVDSTTTHVITVDNLKNASEIINTTNQLLNNNTNNSASSMLTTIGSSNSPKECPIRIRSVANVNSSVEKDMGLGGFGKLLQDKSDHESSSESDGVEIVGVYPVGSKKSMNISVNKSKYVKSNSSGSRSTSPSSIAAQNLCKPVSKVKVSQSDPRRSAERSIMSGEVKEPELDVNQIMRALKELEEMQQSSIHISEGSPPSSSNRSANNSHTSPISYGKDMKQ